MYNISAKYASKLLYLKGVWVFVFSILYSFAISQEYNFNNLNESDGLAQSFVYSIIQDQRGNLWVGTGNGISKYNGFSFENFTTEDSLADNFITSGIADGQDLWFGHMNGGISLYNGKYFRVLHKPVDDMSPVTHLARSSDGRTWSISASGVLMKLKKENGVMQSYVITDLQESVVTFEFINNSELLIGTSAGLYHGQLGDSGNVRILRKVPGIPESRVVCITRARSGNHFYIATENDGVFKLKPAESALMVSPLLSAGKFDFSGIQYLYEDSRSTIWLGTFGNGLIRIRNSESSEAARVNGYNKSNGFFSDNIKVIFEDLAGNIWSGNYGDGLTQITNKVYTVYSFDKEKYGSAVYSIYIGRHFRWIGTEKGLIRQTRETGEIVKFFGKGKELPEDLVTAIYSSDGREIWIGTNENGVYRMDAERGIIRSFPIGRGELENSVTCITGQNNQVWVGTKKGLCNISPETNQIKWYSISQGGLPHNSIHALYADSRGRLWISSRCNTLAYIRNEQVHIIPVDSRSSILTFGPIAEDANSFIWVGSSGNGIYRIESDSVTNLTTKGGLLSDYCYAVISDDKGYIWVGHKNGLSKIRIADLFIKPVQQFKSTDDEYQFNANAVFKDVSGKIWFGTEKGLVIYNPDLEIASVRSPVPYITSIAINNEERDFSNRIVLNPGKYKLRIDFLAINLKDPSLVTYRYKLEGYDQEFETTKSTRVTYNNLTEGRYTFILEALSGDGVASELPVEIVVEIRKPVWKQLWFLPTLVLSLITLLFLYMKRREHRLQGEKKLLEEKVQERTFEIQSQKDEIERHHELIRTKNAEITSSIKYAGHIQGALLPSTDLLNKLFPENFILMQPKDIVSGDFYWFAEKNERIVFTVADCTGHGVPGAFMSLMSITMLNEIVNIKGITDSAEVVNRLHAMINHSLKKSKMDGLDLALCVLDRQKKQIQFTGAMNHLVHIHDGKLNEIKADSFSVNSIRDDFSPFTCKTVDLKRGDMVYLFSDGYMDQFGGDRDKKYSARRFYDTLLEVHQLPMDSQKKALEMKLKEWKRHYEQTDDIMVMGIRF